MSGEPVSVRESLVRQAQSCTSIGSPLYASVLGGLIDDYDRGGVTAALLDGYTAVSATPSSSRLPDADEDW